MKKILCLVLAVIMLMTCFVGCDKASANEDTNITENNAVDIVVGEPIANWRDYTVIIDGNEIAFSQMTVKEFHDHTGYDFEHEIRWQDGLSSNTHNNEVMWNGEKQISVGYANDTGSGFCLPASLPVISIGQWLYQVADKKDAVIFAGDLYVGKEITEKELVSLFGKPDNTWYSDDGSSYSYTYYDNYDEYLDCLKFCIDVTDGVINHISIHNRIEYINPD